MYCLSHQRILKATARVAGSKRIDRRYPLRPLAVASDASTPSVNSPAEPEYVTLRIRKPVGVFFTQKQKGEPIMIDEVTPGGHADKTGQIQVGDILAKCSAVVLKEGAENKYDTEGYGEKLYTNWETVMFDCEGQDFKTVMAALKSNNGRWGINDVTLVLRKGAKKD